MKKNLRTISPEDLGDFLRSIGEPSYKLNQILDWLWKHHVTSLEEMSNLSKKVREQLQAKFELQALSIHDKKVAQDGTIKLVCKTWDGFFIESVLIPTSERKTACVSSQVGCSLDCAFCATGKLKRERNLEFYEIVDQFFLLEKIAMELYEEPLTNVVFMGMGEPLLNYKNVVKSIEVLSDQRYRRFSPYRVTVSTAGIAKAIEQLGEDEVRFELALSLHATTDAKRSQVMSINQSNNIDRLLESLDFFYRKTRNKITLEYLLLKGFNDSIQDAIDLARLYRRIPVKTVNLIEYNDTTQHQFVGADEATRNEFVEELKKFNVNVHVRKSRGKDIDAACGQLATKTAKLK